MTKAEFIKAQGAPFQGEGDLAGKILGYIFDNCLKNGGKSTVAALNAVTKPVKGTMVFMTDGGSLTLGTLTVAAKDIVVYDGTNWVLYQDFA